MARLRRAREGESFGIDPSAKLKGGGLWMKGYLWRQREGIGSRLRRSPLNELGQVARALSETPSFASRCCPFSVLFVMHPSRCSPDVLSGSSQTSPLGASVLC